VKKALTQCVTPSQKVLQCSNALIQYGMQRCYDACALPGSAMDAMRKLRLLRHSLVHGGHHYRLKVEILPMIVIMLMKLMIMMIML
jgi:hypothetical protein